MHTIGARLGIGVGILLAIGVAIGLVCYIQTRVVGSKIEAITELKEPVNSAVYGLENNVVETGFAVVGYLSTADQRLLGAMRKNEDLFDESREKYLPVADIEKGQALEVRLDEGYKRFRALSEGLISLKDSQSASMDSLLARLDEIDALLAEHIRPSISAADPLAYKRLRSVLEMEVNINAISKGLGSFLLTNQPRFESRVNDAESRFKRFLEAYRTLLISSNERGWAAQLDRLSGVSFTLAGHIIDLEKEKSQKLGEYMDTSRELRSILDDRIQVQTERNLSVAKADVLDTGKRANATILLMLVCGVFFGVLAGTVTTRNITIPLRHLASVMDSIARGNTAQRVTLTTSDEIRSLGEAFNLMTTKLVRANEELRISEERIRFMVEGVRDYAILMLDPQGHVATWNAGAERINGYNAAEIFGKHYSIFYPPEDVRGGKPGRLLAEAATNGRTEDTGWRVRKDGTRFWAHVVITALRGNDGVLQGFSKVTRDVTKQKLMEEELRESEIRFRTIFEDAPIGVALVDDRGRFMDTNPAIQEMVGFAEPELVGKGFAEAVSPDAVHDMETLFADTMSGKRTHFHAELKYRRRDGRSGWGNLNVSRMHTHPEHAPCGIVMMEDITARKATEQQMRMLAHTITSMNECVVITDSSHMILSVNPAFLRTYGYQELEIVGRRIDVLRPAPAPDDVPEELLAAIAAGGWTGELMNVRKNGELFPILLSTSVVRDDDGQPVALVGIARDITEQKQLQHQLMEAERRRSQDLRRFAVSIQQAQEDERSRISRELHDDLCQRLSGMKLRAEVLEDDVRPFDRRVSHRLRDFTQELDRSITEVRRISSNLRPNVLSDFGLVIALRMLCKEFEKLHAIRTNVRLSNAVPRHPDANVEIALYRIAQEALSNAAKHAHADSVGVSLDHQNSLMRLTVKDNGDGFDPDEAARSKESGHGLGLISMKERSELLGGTFQIDSVRGHGTTITVTIPMGTHDDNEEDQDSDR